ncbi:MAG: succinylglutamate desuccinylase/aspartoacylase family protein [bacterium]
MTDELIVEGVSVAPGQRRTVRIPVAQRLTAGDVEIPVEVIRGRAEGPRLFVCAALHGDELNGTEIVRRLLRMPLLRRLRGALLAVPVVNVYGFVSQTRYLPDRRDLNRSFPGSAKGSLAARLANTFLTQIVENATHGVDLHTGSLHRTNLPQIRANLSAPGVEEMARAFGAPVILDAGLREGSLRMEADVRKIPMIVYEAGEALRFDEFSIRAGVRGVISVMRQLGMLPATRPSRRVSSSVIAHKSVWVRAPETGILTTRLKLGQAIEKRSVLGAIADPIGVGERLIRSPVDGVLIGRTHLPLANEGDALFHIATFEKLADVIEGVGAFRDELEIDALD